MFTLSDNYNYIKDIQQCMLIKTRIHICIRKSIFICSIYFMCVRNTPLTGKFSLIWGISIILCTGLTISITSRLKQGGRLTQDTKVKGSLPDQNYYDSLCYCIYLCSSFVDHCSEEKLSFVAFQIPHYLCWGYPY